MKETSCKPWFVYILECSNGRLYTGITNDLDARFKKHSSGKGAMFTRLNRPARMIAAKQCENRSEASKLEWRVKQMKPQEKRAEGLKWSTVRGWELSLPVTPEANKNI